jgi:hypothetical protein
MALQQVAEVEDRVSSGTGSRPRSMPTNRRIGLARTRPAHDRGDEGGGGLTRSLLSVPLACPVRWMALALQRGRPGGHHLRHLWLLE